MLTVSFAGPDDADSDTSSQDYKLASSRTPSSHTMSPTRNYDWLDTPAFKHRAQLRMQAVEEQLKDYSNSPMIDLENRFYKSLAQLHSTLDNYSPTEQNNSNEKSWKSAWEKWTIKQHDLDLFSSKEYDYTMSIIQDLEKSNNAYKIELERTQAELEKMKEENGRLNALIKRMHI